MHNRGVLIAGLLVTFLLGACGRVAPAGPAPAPELTTFQALVAGAPDPEGNVVTQRYDSASGRVQTTLVPGNAVGARFAPAGAISYLLPDAVRSLDANSSSPRVEATAPSLLMAGFAWGAGGTLAYVAHPGARGPDGELVIVPAGGPPATVPLPVVTGRALPLLRFSPDGELLLLVDTTVAGGAPRTTLQVRGLDGGLRFTASDASEATWAGNRRLYYWDGSGVEAADLATGVTRTIMPGVRWYGPDTSPDGLTVTFELRDDRGQPRLGLLDATTDTVQAGFQRDGGSRPRFVSNTEIWFQDTSAHSPIVSLDLARLTEASTGLSGVVADVRQVPQGTT